MYKNKKAAKIAKEYYKGTTAWVNENGETLMFFGGTDVILHFLTILVRVFSFISNFSIRLSGRLLS